MGMRSKRSRRIASVCPRRASTKPRRDHLDDLREHDRAAASTIMSAASPTTGLADRPEKESEEPHSSATTQLGEVARIAGARRELRLHAAHVEFPATWPQRLGKRNPMQEAVFGAALTDGPECGVEVEFRPEHDKTISSGTRPRISGFRAIQYQNVQVLRRRKILVLHLEQRRPDFLDAIGAEAEQGIRLALVDRQAKVADRWAQLAAVFST